MLRPTTTSKCDFSKQCKSRFTINTIVLIVPFRCKPVFIFDNGDICLGFNLVNLFASNSILLKRYLNQLPGFSQLEPLIHQKSRLRIKLLKKGKNLKIRIRVLDRKEKILKEIRTCGCPNVQYN